MARVSFKDAQTLTLRQSCSFSAPLSALQEASHFSVGGGEFGGLKTARTDMKSSPARETQPFPRRPHARQIKLFFPSFPSTLLLIYQMTSQLCGSAPSGR